MSNLPILDYAFLAFESDESPKHVAGLQIFDLPTDASEDFVARLVEKAKTAMPTWPFNQRLRIPLLGMPQWTEDSLLDLDHHVFFESVPSPSDNDALLERIAELHAERLDHGSALWEVYFFEHLEPRRFAIYFKVHHAYMDGVSLSKRAMGMLSTQKRKRSSVAFWGNDGHETQNVRKDIVASLFGTARSAGRAAMVLPLLAKIGLKHGLRLLNLSGGELPVPFTAPRTALNTPLTRARSVAVADISLNRVHAVARHAGVTVNDVVLELCDKALTRHLGDTDALPEKPLVAQMPISLRSADGGQGNQLTIALLELGSSERDPIKRLQKIHENASHVKEEFTGMFAEAAEVYTLLLQSVAQFSETTGLSAFIPPLGNVVISDVIGPQKQLYLRGAPLVATYPISAIAPGLALNITIYSYHGMLHFGLVAGKEAIPDLRPMISYLSEALTELERLMGLATKKPKAARKRSKGVRHV